MSSIEVVYFFVQRERGGVPMCYGDEGANARAPAMVGVTGMVPLLHITLEEFGVCYGMVWYGMVPYQYHTIPRVS